MKKILSLISGGLFLSAMVLTSCEGPAGPTGPEGPQGPAGDNGIASCGQCHDLSTDLYAKVIQWETSLHAIGGHFERNDATCAICHTHEGYVDNLATGAGSSEAALIDPTPINCRTCHKIHDTYTSDDWALRSTEPVTFFDGTVSKDFGVGNQCASCHQSRSYDVAVIGGADIAVTSSRYGPHYGPQSNIISGNGFVQLTGSANYPSTNPHANVVGGCVGCHMAPGYGVQNGGHTFRMLRTDGTTYNLNGCTGCHASMTSADVTAFKGEVQVLYDSLLNVLVSKGLLTTAGNTVLGTYSPEKAAAMGNWRTVYGDHSMGVHNPGLIKAVLQNSIETANGF